MYVIVYLYYSSQNLNYRTLGATDAFVTRLLPIQRGFGALLLTEIFLASMKPFNLPTSVAKS